MKTKTIYIASFIALLFIGLFILTGCNDDGNSNQNNSKTPVGLYRLVYTGNAEGEYVEEYNIYTDFYNNPITLQETMYNNKDAVYYSLNADGTGFYITKNGKFDVKITETTLTNQDGKPFPYTLKGDKIILSYDSSTEKFDVFEKTTQKMIDMIREGKGGSVPIEEANVGDLVAIGKYDTRPNNEELEYLMWRVIDKKDGKLLVISDKLIDSFSFNYNPSKSNIDDVTWEKSSLRQFLNKEFITMQMTEDEAKMIATTHNTNKASNKYLKGIWNFTQNPYTEMATQNHRDDPDTDDKVFLLSLDEVLKYFPGEEDPIDKEYPFSALKSSKNRTAYVTKSVDDKGKGYYDLKTLAGCWMTRTLSDVGNKVVYITSRGEIYNYFTYVPLFIRPAMWINVPSN